MTGQHTSAGGAKGLSVRPLREGDLSAADGIFRRAFGTFLGLPDPAAFAGDADYVRARWVADPAAAFGAELGGELVGSNFATNWGSVGFFGPLTVRPDLWDGGIGRRLMEPVMERFDAWGTRHAGLFTFAHSAKHVGFYRTFGFWPRFLTAVASRPVRDGAGASGWSTYSDVPESDREACLAACRELTDAIFEGLDVTREVLSASDQALGDTVLLWDGAELAGMAVCHCGPGSEAGSGSCYVKFGAARPGPSAGDTFDRLLDACEALAAARGLTKLVAGTNMAREEASRRMFRAGFRTELQGVAMHRPNEPGYGRADAYVVDDWR